MLFTVKVDYKWVTKKKNIYVQINWKVGRQALYFLFSWSIHTIQIAWLKYVM